MHNLYTNEDAPVNSMRFMDVTEIERWNDEVYFAEPVYRALESLDGPVGQRGAPEIGMHNNAGGVDDTPGTRRHQ